MRFRDLHQRRSYMLDIVPSSKIPAPQERVMSLWVLVIPVGQPISLPIHTYPCGFGAVVDDALLEPWMFQCLLGGDALSGVVDEDLPE